MSAGTPTPGHGRREFLSRVGGSAAVAAALTGALPAPVAAHDDDDFQHFRDVHRVSQRARDAFEVRLKAALFQMRSGTSQHRSNGDERRYENKIGSFSSTFHTTQTARSTARRSRRWSTPCGPPIPRTSSSFPSAAPASWSTRRPDSRSASAARTRRRAPCACRRDSPARKPRARWWSCTGRCWRATFPSISTPPIRRSRRRARNCRR